MLGIAEGLIEPTTTFGDRWTDWTQRPNRFLDGLTSSDFAQSQEGISIVLAMLRQHGEFEKFRTVKPKTLTFSS